MQLQDSGRWTDAATLAATHLEGSDYARSFLLPVFVFLRIGYSNCFDLALTSVYLSLSTQGIAEVG